MAVSISLPDLQEFYTAEFARIRKAFEADGDGPKAVSAGTDLIDALVTRLHAAFFSQDPEGPAKTCLVALGGYGRRVLLPQSDVDLLFLHEDAAAAAQAKEPTAELCRILWDLRLRLGQSTRTLTELESFDPDNAEFSIAVLDCRRIAGDPRLFVRMRESILPKVVARERGGLIAGLAQLTEKRHVKYGHTIFHLEPNIKEAPGGIRDYDVARWLVRISELEKNKKWVEPSDHWPRGLGEEATRGFRFLLTVRCFLHYRRGRDDNSLSYEFQDEAASLGLGLEQRQAVDPADWMRAYYRHVRAIDRLVTQMIDEIPAAPSYLYDSYKDWRSRRSNSDFWVRREHVSLRNPQALDDPAALLAPFEFVARHGIPLSAQAEEQIEQAAARAAAAAGSATGLWPRLAAILKLPHAARALRAMNRVGLLGTLIPEFRAIDALVIRDFYHRYTVDEHTFRTIENLHRLREPQQDWERGFADISKTLERPDLLYFALLLHDVGKGMPEDDHVVGSLQVVEAVTKRLKLDAEEAAMVRFLVGGHLEMSATMQRRDVFDADTIRVFAEKMATTERLKMLCLLTYADIRSVNPEALTPWKAGALWHLYARASNYLIESVDEKRFHSGGEAVREVQRILPYLDASADAGALASFLEGLPLRYLASHGPEEIAQDFAMSRRVAGDRVELRVTKRNHLFELRLLTGDRPFLFANIAGVLFAWGMNVVKADAFASQAGLALDSFEFADLHQTLELNPSEGERLAESVSDVLAGRASLETMLARRGGGAIPAGLEMKVKIATQLRFDDSASTHSTLLELIAQDRPGLIYRVSRVLAESGCNIEIALVDTEGPKAIDVFYLTADGKKLDAARQETLRAVLLTELGAV
ncbi:MAG: [protein-PII] uridylyltransferase [Candidatus Acidiferrales bacterium]